MQAGLPRSKGNTPVTVGSGSGLIPLRLRYKKTAILSILLLCFFYIIYHTYSYISPPKLIYIPKQNQHSTLLSELIEQGVSLNILDYRLLRRYPYPKSGWIRFDPKNKLSRDEFVKALHEKPREKTRRIVMFGGESIKDFANRTAIQTKLSADRIVQQYHHHSPFKEGGIMAGYYQIPYRATPSAITYYMSYISLDQFKTLAEKYMEGFSLAEWEKILIIASIIQKETQAPDEMPFISSVIQNRLAKNMKLQMDATLNYGRYSQKAVTPGRIKNDKSRYNTYLYKGLPPHPIGSATIEAVMAALQPIKSDYLYFMLASGGTHNFSSTYKEHLTNIRWYNQQKEKNTTLPQKSTNQQLDTMPQPIIKVKE